MSATHKHPKHIVFIPGFMCDARLYAPQIQSISNMRVTHSVETMTQGATIREFAKDILDRVPKNTPENPSGRFALVGLSMGGIVALEILRQAPERISHLALLNTTPYADSSATQRKAHISRVKNGELITILADELKPRYLSPFSSHETILPLITDMGEALGSDIFTRQSIALMIRKSALEILPSIYCPTLIITGEDDNICPPIIHEHMARLIPNSDLHVIPNCGHLSTLEAPIVITQLLWNHWGFSNTNVVNFPTNNMYITEKHHRH